MDIFSIEMEQITKRFPGVLALNNVNLAVKAGEVHALMGENGAGKSTLMKILGGVYSKDSGVIRIKGNVTEIHNPHQAKCLGISIIHQELNMVPELSVAQNMFLGREPHRCGVIDWKKLHCEARRILTEFEIDVEPHTPIYKLGIAIRQMIEIAKDLSTKADIVVMDEPTAALTFHEIEQLFSLIARLRQRGVSIIYISHRMEEVFQIADRATVLRDGSTVGTVHMDKVTPDELIRMMVGREINELFPKGNQPSSEEALRIDNFSTTTKLKNVSFHVRKGEILGIAGLVGSGRTELARAIFGADPKLNGATYVFGAAVAINSPRDAIRCGIGFLTEDRGRQGIIPEMDICSNMTITVVHNLCRLGWLNCHAKQKLGERYHKMLAVKAASLKTLIKNLSGGNQQKVVLAKWLATEAKIIIFDEPTRGIDVGAKQEVYKLMSDLANQGVAVLMISSDLREILGMSDRILVMQEGRVTGQLKREEASQEKILHLATGGKVNG